MAKNKNIEVYQVYISPMLGYDDFPVGSEYNVGYRQTLESAERLKEEQLSRHPNYRRNYRGNTVEIRKIVVEP